MTTYPETVSDTEVYQQLLASLSPEQLLKVAMRQYEQLHEFKQNISLLEEENFEISSRLKSLKRQVDSEIVVSLQEGM